MENPLVSIIVPSYNHEKYVKQSINSIINQTYTNIQLIVIDDGSRDNTPAIIKDLADKHHFEFEHQENLGLPKTLNKVIQKYVRGKYLCFLASDDFLPPDSIEKRVAFMEKNPDYAVGYGRRICVDTNSVTIHYDDEDFYCSGSIFNDLFLANFWISAPTAIMKREVLEIVGLYDESLVFEDYYMWLKIAHKFPIGFIDDYLAFYRIHGMNFHLNNKVLLDQQKIILDAYTDHPLYRRAITNWHYRNFCSFCISDKKRALVHMVYALRYFYKKDFIRSLVRFIFYKNYGSK
jgi:alpha-1,3-rhamnosyltransferase